VRAVILCLVAAGLLTSCASGQQPDPGMAGHDHADHTMADMPGMQMSASTPDWMPSPHAGSGTAWEPASVPAHNVDDDA
jgi:hypothetical protein